MAWVAVKGVTQAIVYDYWLDEEGYIMLDETGDPIYD